MMISLHQSVLGGAVHFRREVPVSGAAVSAKLKEPEATRRRRALVRVDREISKGNFKGALSLVKRLQGKPGGLRGFGAAKQIPRRLTSLDKLNLSGLDISALQSLIDSILESIQHCIQFALPDEVSLSELESLVHVESYNSQYDNQLKCMQHEAGHFLVGYLIGVLPKGYLVSAAEAMSQAKYAGGKTEFPGFESLIESKGKPSLTTVNRFLCVILAGLAAEHLVFGHSEGHHSDIEKLDRVLKGMGLTESEADAQVRWAALNTVLILSRHREARSRLSEAMALGRSIGFCIDTIENSLNCNDL